MTRNRITEFAYCWRSHTYRRTKDEVVAARDDAFAEMAREDDCDQDFAFPVCDYAEMRGAVMSAVQRVGRARVFAILLQLTGVEDLSLIPAEQYGEVYDAMQFLDSNP